MSDGTGSTLKLNPEEQTAITFNLTGGTDGVSTYTYIVDMGRVDLNEERRLQWLYDQNRLGSRVTTQQNNLVPITFTVIIKAVTSDYRREAYRTLQRALQNRRGGTLQYKPEDAGGGVLDTYYHYVASPAPRLQDDPSNRWDAAAQSDGFYRLIVDIELQTQPIATSDPDSPVVVSDLSVVGLDNWVSSSPSYTNRVSVNSSQLKGSLPALLNLYLSSNDKLGRVILMRRSAEDGTLANLKTVHEAEDASVIYPSVAWTEVSDANRGGGKYMKCTPSTDANGEAQGLRFIVANAEDLSGRFAVFGVGYDDALSTGVWTHQAKINGGNTIQEGNDDYYATSLHSWQLIYVGEFEFPLVEFAYGTTEAYGCYLEWYSTRASGESEFRLDGLMLVWISDALGADGDGTALDMKVDYEDIRTTDNLVLSNLLKYGRISETAYLVDASSLFEANIPDAPRGDFPILDPTVNHLLIFIQELYHTPNFTDDFSSYEGNRWLAMARGESDEVWGTSTGTATFDNTHYLEGDTALKSAGSGNRRVIKTVDFNFDDDGRFTDNDYVLIHLYIDTKTGLTSISLEFITTSGSDYFYYTFAAAVLVTGWNHLKVKRSDFLQAGSPDWGAIVYVGMNIVTSGSNNIWLDYIRAEKADPNITTVGNATGSRWNFQPNEKLWTITEDVSEDSSGAVLACLDTENGVEKSALYDESNTPNDVRYLVRVMAKHNDGQVGAIWRSGNDTLTAGAEDCYVALLNTATHTISVYEYANGSTSLKGGTGLSPVSDRWYTVGVIAKGDSHRVFAALSSGLSYEDNAVFDEDYLVLSFTDTTLSSGKCGIMSIGTLGRFDNVVIEDITDKHKPADTLTMSGRAVFRTISPFDE